MSDFQIKSKTRVSEGTLIRFSHLSSQTKSVMTCSVFEPTTKSDEKCPCLLYLSGLTCTDENVCQKSGIFKSLCQNKIAFIAPDTSPRGLNIPGDSDSWDFGVGAGFYLDATEEPWNTNYNMYSYITQELLQVVASHFSSFDTMKVGITGHSMGGHGAISIALKNPQLFKSVSAFAPICNPINCPWGKKAFTGYLGTDETKWEEYDSCKLITKSSISSSGTNYDDILIDVGTADSFYTNGQLLPEAFQKACEASNQKVTLRFQDGFDHSYYFISTFIEDHVNFHAQRLK